MLSPACLPTLKPILCLVWPGSMRLSTAFRASKQTRGRNTNTWCSNRQRLWSARENWDAVSEAPEEHCLVSVPQSIYGRKCHGEAQGDDDPSHSRTVEHVDTGHVTDKRDMEVQVDRVV